MHKPQILQETPDFSLVLGGPLYQLCLRSRIAQPPLGLVHRRILVITLIAWLPLLPLALTIMPLAELVGHLVKIVL